MTPKRRGRPPVPQSESRSQRVLNLLRVRPHTTRELCEACPDLDRDQIETTIAALRRSRKIYASEPVARSEGSTGRAYVARWAVEPTDEEIAALLPGRAS